MLQQLGRKFVELIPTMLGMILVTFIITKSIPGDPLAAILGQRALSNPEIVANYRQKWGLDKSLPEQFAVYIINLFQGDMGQSIRTQRPVITDLKQFFPATAELALCAMFVAVSGGVSLGILAALKSQTWIDQLVRVIALIGSSMPVFWMALIVLQIFYAGLSWLPGPGRLDNSLTPPQTITGMYVVDGILTANWKVVFNALEHLILPSIVLGWYELGLIARITRASMLEVISADYIRTARSKGLRENVVTLRHAFPNAILPVVTVIGLAVAGLLAGAVQTETIFAWPGIGRYAVNSSETLDFPAIMGVTLVISIIFVITNLIVDLLYGVLDPRVRAK
jgi:peptide/nickel transport system permease protein